MSSSSAGARWNHNIHYHRIVLRSAPAGARSALDIGTGDGLLAHDLREVIPQVVGLDVDAAVLERASSEDDRVQWVHGDFLIAPLELGSFDLVASIATVHHFPDVRAALSRMADLTAPGGVVVVVGLARSATPTDFLWDAVGMVWHRILLRRHDVWDHSAPIVWPPSSTYGEMRRVVRRVLPGARFRRLALWRYAVVWSKSDS